MTRDFLADFERLWRTNVKKKAITDAARVAAEACIKHREAGDSRQAKAAERRAMELLRQEMALEREMESIVKPYRRRWPGEKP